jgi:hypothetical protein
MVYLVAALVWLIAGGVFASVFGRVAKTYGGD